MWRFISGAMAITSFACGTYYAGAVWTAAWLLSHLEAVLDWWLGHDDEDDELDD